MTKLFTIIGLCVSFSVLAKITGPVRLGNSPFADTEISTNVVFSAWTDRMFAFEYELAFDGTPSNNVQVVFGTDANGDGELSPEEERLAVGWDCGEWFMRNVPEEIAISHAPLSDDGPQSLRFSLRIFPDGGFGPLDIRDDGVPTFAALAAAPPAWLHDRSWNVCRLTARGAGTHASAFVVKTTSNGTRFILR